MVTEQEGVSGKGGRLDEFTSESEEIQEII